jgi:hypothetical protein
VCVCVGGVTQRSECGGVGCVCWGAQPGVALGYCKAMLAALGNSEKKEKKSSNKSRHAQQLKDEITHTCMCVRAVGIRAWL